MAWYRCTGGNSGPAPTPVVEPYIYNIGRCSFNTGYTHKADTEIYMKAVPTLYAYNSTSSYNTMFGSLPNGDANKYKRYGFASSNNNNSPTYYRAGISQSGNTPWSDSGTNFLWMNVPTIFHFSGSTAEWWRADDTETINSITIADPVSIEDGLNPIALFAKNYNTSSGGFSVTDYGNMLLYYFDAYEDGDLVHHFVPAYNNDQYCLKDMVDNTYIYDTYSNGLYVRGFIPS